jgi:hypothetical protein
MHESEGGDEDRRWRLGRKYVALHQQQPHLPTGVLLSADVASSLPSR